MQQGINEIKKFPYVSMHYYNKVAKNKHTYTKISLGFQVAQPESRLSCCQCTGGLLAVVIAQLHEKLEYSLPGSKCSHLHLNHLQLCITMSKAVHTQTFQVDFSSNNQCDTDKWKSTYGNTFITTSTITVA